MNGGESPHRKGESKEEKFDLHGYGDIWEVTAAD
jgi:hypothetical protein